MQRVRLVASLLISLCAAPIARAANPNDFTVFSMTGLPGRLYVPSSYTPSQSYPLVLFFHGAGEAGTNNTAQVNANIDGLLAAAKERNFFLYAPQSSTSTWGSTAATATLDVQRAISMIGTAESTYHIDPNRIYITGLSNGGGGCWDAYATYPNLFAAAIPICGVLGSSVFQPTLDHKPIWTFHARNDPTVSVNNTRNMVNAILSSDHLPTLTFPTTSDPNDAYWNLDNGRLQYYEFATGGHIVWPAVYNAPVVYDWLLAQSLISPEPGVFPFLALSLIYSLSRPGRRIAGHPGGPCSASTLTQSCKR